MRGCWWHYSYLHSVTIAGACKTKADFTPQEWDAFQNRFDDCIHEIYVDRQGWLKYILNQE